MAQRVVNLPSSIRQAVVRPHGISACIMHTLQLTGQQPMAGMPAE